GLAGHRHAGAHRGSAPRRDGGRRLARVRATDRDPRRRAGRAPGRDGLRMARRPAMSTELIGLAALMGLATYPWRAIPLLAPGMDRLPEAARVYTRLVAPAVLAALAAVGTMVRTGAAGVPSFHVGAEWLAVGLAIAIVAWPRN